MAKQTFTTGQVLTADQMTSLQQTAMGGGSPVTKTASYTLVASDAGTVIQMNSASATTITVNTGLFSAGDSVQIQNIGAGVCTVTAGTATVTTSGSLALSQWEGGDLYFTTTSASIFFDVTQASGMTNPMTTTGDTIYSSPGSTPVRLGIGATGNVLTVAGGVPTWAAPASSGGLTLLSTTNITAVAQVSITGISQSYKNLFIVLNGFRPGTTSTTLQMTLETSGAVAVPAQVIETFYNGAAGTLTSNAPIQVCNDMSNAAVGVNGANVWIYNYASTTLTKGINGQSNVYGVTNGNYRVGNFGGYTYSSTGIGAVSTLKFNPSLGSWTANGTIQIYGEN